MITQVTLPVPAQLNKILKSDLSIDPDHNTLKSLNPPSDIELMNSRIIVA